MNSYVTKLYGPKVSEVSEERKSEEVFVGVKKFGCLGRNLELRLDRKVFIIRAHGGIIRDTIVKRWQKVKERKCSGRGK